MYFRTAIIGLLVLLSLTVGPAAVCAAGLDRDLVGEGESLAAKGETARSLLTLNRFIDGAAAGGLSHGDSVLLLRAVSCNALNYQSLGNAHQALAYFQRAIALAKVLNDRKRLATLYNNVFGIYYQQREYEQAEELLRRSLAINTAAGDSTAIRNNYNNLGLVALNRKDYSEALRCYNLALTYTPPTDRVGRSLILTNRADLYGIQGQLEKEEQELHRALALQNGMPVDSRTIQTRLNMALLKAHLGKDGESRALQPAIYRALPRLPLATRVNSLAQLADIHFVLGDSLAALNDILEYQTMKDSLDRAANASQLQQLLVAYDTERLRQTNASLRQTADFYRLSARHRMMVVYCVAFFLLVFVVLVVLLFRRWRSDKQKSRLISEQQAQLLRYEQAEHRRKQSLLTSELDHKNRQLTTYTLDLASINEFHGRISQALTQLRETVGDEASSKALREVILSLQHFNDKPLGDDFRLYFDEVHPGFLHLLEQDYHLSKSDLRLCAYLYLGMTTKEIAALTYKEVRSVESSRNRLRKKLNLPAGSDLQAFFANVAAKSQKDD